MSEKRTVLAVDDEPKILGLLKSYLEASGYAALCAQSGREGMNLFERHEVSLILLDIMLPDFSGEDFCKKVRLVSQVPIVMITAKADEASIIQGLNIGADDYVCKPFSPRQLMARIEAVLRRADAAGAGAAGTAVAAAAAGAAAGLAYMDLALDTEKRAAYRGGQNLNLTKDEYNILKLLMSRQAKVFTREEILAAVKGDDYYVFDRAIDSHIKKLRAKIGDDPKSPAYISTVYGVGYRLGNTD
ncbi:MAG: response regulator transcription factor [Spirochaetes bacterium]|nr:response regulator transcription factor [Spirochaetota bacterium]